MARKIIKFNLLVDGVRCKSVEDVSENFNLLDIIAYYKSNKLYKWAKVRKLEILDDIENIQAKDDFELAKALCKIFDIEFSDSDIQEELDIKSILNTKDGLVDDNLVKRVEDLEISLIKMVMEKMHNNYFIDINLLNKKLIDKVSEYISKNINKYIYYDKDTNLSWQLDHQYMTWYEAKEYAEYLNKINYCGYNNWRLPTKEELKELYNKKSNTPFENDGSSYWTNEGGVDRKGYYYFYDFNFYNGSYEKYRNSISTKHYVRCVRDGN